jgi:hypothetical protein
VEYGIAPVKKFIAILSAAFVLQVSALVQAQEQRIVIIAGADSHITALTAKEVRRAYLGASIVLNGIEIKPLRNQTNKLTEEVFLQKILYMSAEAYDRQLLARAFRGGDRPKVYENLAELLDALQEDNAAITFMLYGTAVTTPGIRIIDNP